MNFLIEVERVLESNIFLLTNLLDEGDKLIKSRSQILLIKQSNIGDFKSHPLPSLINKSDLLVRPKLGIIIVSISVDPAFSLDAFPLDGETRFFSFIW